MITFTSFNILPNHLHIKLVINLIHLRYSSFVELYYEIYLITQNKQSIFNDLEAIKSLVL